MAMNVLVVDDCSTTRKLLSYMVKGAGFNPITASNGLEALEKLAIHDVSLILTDMNMPGMDGIELTRQVRSDGRYSHIPVIMITTEAGEEDQRYGKEAGVDIYLTKPISAEKLATCIKRLITSKEARP